MNDNEKLWATFNYLWGVAKDSSVYDKQEWMAMEGLLLREVGYKPDPVPNWKQQAEQWKEAFKEMVEIRDSLSEQLAKARGVPAGDREIERREVERTKDEVRDQVVAEIVADLRGRLKPDGEAKFKELLEF